MALWTSAIEKGTLIIHKDRIVEVMDVAHDYDTHMNVATIRAIVEASDNKNFSYAIAEYKLNILENGAGYDISDMHVYHVLVDKES